MDKNTTVTSEAVGALDARMPFRFPRELVVVLVVFAVLWEIVSWLVPPFVVPGWEPDFQEPASRCGSTSCSSRSPAWSPPC